MKLTWFGHSAFRVEVRGKIVLIDPFITNPSFRGDPEAAWAGATHVVLTHGHDDHIGNTVRICRETEATLVANAEICSYLAARGVKNLSPMNIGGQVDFGDFAVALVPAWHSSSTVVDGVPVYMGNPAGVMLIPKGGRALYHMGDTDIFTDMALINEFHTPAFGIVPIGDRFTMGGRSAARACQRYFSFEKVIPCHYGTFPIIDPTPDLFIKEMAGSSTKIIVPDVGRPFDLHEDS